MIFVIIILALIVKLLLDVFAYYDCYVINVNNAKNENFDQFQIKTKNINDFQIYDQKNAKETKETKETFEIPEL